MFADNFKTDVYAVFGSLDYKLANNVQVGAALRYDSEYRKVNNLVPIAADPITGGPINPGQAFGPISDKSAKDVIHVLGDWPGFPDIWYGPVIGPRRT